MASSKTVYLNLFTQLYFNLIYLTNAAHDNLEPYLATPVSDSLTYYTIYYQHQLAAQNAVSSCQQEVE